MVDAFANLIESIHRVLPGSRLEPATVEQLAAERQNPDVPSHYLEFLERVGWGTLGDSNFRIYSGLIGPDDFFDPVTAAELSGVLLLGDDFAGWMVGFDTRAGWRLVGLDSGSDPQPLEQLTLVDFIAQRVADSCP